MPAGRPTKYTPELVAKAWDYIDNYAEEYNHAMPSIVGMAIVLNVAKSRLYVWAEEKDNEFKDILSVCMSAQELTLFNKGLSGDFNSTITKLALTKHNYSDKTASEHSGPGGGPIKSEVGVWQIEIVD